MENLSVIEVKGQRVLSTEQLAKAYETEQQIVTNNYNRNQHRYLEGKHFVCLKSEEKSEFIKKNQNDFSSYTKAKAIYLWTEKGALLHAKSLNTDKAWEVYEYLVDFYFHAKEEQGQQASEQSRKNEVVPIITKVEQVKDVLPEKSVSMFGPAKAMVVNVPDNMEAGRLIVEMRKYLAGMDAMLDVYNMYLKVDEFQSIQRAIGSLLRKMSVTAHNLGKLKPQEIEKFI